MIDPAATRRQDALTVADELLADIELSRIPPADVARKAFRLARLIDDADAMTWLRFEIGGYPSGSLPTDAWQAAGRSRRWTTNDDGEQVANTATLGQMATAIEATMLQISSASGGPPYERSAARNYAASMKAVLDNVVGAIHEYVTDRYQELRFGSAAETAFEVVRNDVDARIAELVPEAPGMLAAAFENAASANPEHWAGAAATCRRLLKAAADALRPPGDPVKGRAMSEPAYINRLIDWILQQSESRTAAEFAVAELEYLGRRLDAVDDAGHKGAHARVDRFDAARFLTGTYLALGDILRLAAASDATAGDGRIARMGESAARPALDSELPPEDPPSAAI